MKTKIFSVQVFLIFQLLYSVLFGSRFEYSIQTCYFPCNKSGEICRINCEVNCTTTFILPEGESVSEIIEPTGSWRVNSDNRRFVYVVPDKKGIHTSLDIITKKDEIYSFILEEISGNHSGGEIIKQVRIMGEKGKFFRLTKRLAIKKVVPEKPEYKKLRYRYRIRDKYFFISEVYDDGIFTTINIGRSQLRPAIFVNKKRGKPHPEVVRYVDNGKEYIVHRVLETGEYFVLKYGKKESLIGRY